MFKFFSSSWFSSYFAVILNLIINWSFGEGALPTLQMTLTESESINNNIDYIS